MDPTLKSTATPNLQCLFHNEDPNLTISDDNDDKNKTLRDSSQKKCHGRWSNHEQLIFLKNLVDSKDDFNHLVSLLSSRNLPQIRLHTIHFIRMCKKEFSVSKTKQQNKLILNHICNNYGFHPTDAYLEQLEEIILNPSKEMLREVKVQLRKTIKKNSPIKNKKTSQLRKKKKERFKQRIFSIAKIPKTSPKVINIVTINVMTNTQSSGNGCSSNNNNDISIQSHGLDKRIGQIKKYGPDPFNIEFEPILMRRNSKTEKKINKLKEEDEFEEDGNDKNKRNYDSEEDDNVMSNIIQDHHVENNLDSSLNDFDSIN